MRHGKKFNHLGRTAAHRKAMLANMACSLIEHKRITTTVAKAKALRKYVEPLLTKAKTDTTHSRRVVFSYLKNKYAVSELFDEISEKIADRPGGYTRIIKLGNRLGDNAETALIELVDYNELLLEAAEESKSKTRRGGRRRRKKSSESEQAAVAAEEVQEEEVEEKTEEPKEEAPQPEASAETVETETEEATTEEVEETSETPEAASEAEEPESKAAEEEEKPHKKEGEDDDGGDTEKK